MFEWITAHLATVLTGLVVLGILAAVAVQMVRDHKNVTAPAAAVRMPPAAVGTAGKRRKAESMRFPAGAKREQGERDPNG
jgi:hypothetical protein